ncbi:acyltransferase [Yeosuana marina]|uniref:acyltransferase n=1 Tax=Yeosuana marina TaxID=1565536 RepID=UPI0030C7FC31
MIRSFLDNAITKIKKQEFVLDKEIPIKYLFNLSFEKFLMLVRGFFNWNLLHKGRFFLIGKRCVLKCVSKISVGNGVLIERNCYIDGLSMNGIILGDYTSIGMNTTIICSGTFKNIGKGLKVGHGVGLGTHGFFGCAGGVEIGNNTIFGNFVSLHSENHNFSNTNELIKNQGVNRKGIVIGENCWIGSKATILDGVIMENGVIIAAGAVVKEGVYKENGIYGGVPAKFLKTRNND